MIMSIAPYYPGSSAVCSQNILRIFWDFYGNGGGILSFVEQQPHSHECRIGVICWQLCLPLLLVVDSWLILSAGSFL